MKFSSSVATGEHYDAFISYAHTDEDWVKALAENLHNAGLDVFYAPWEIGPGDIFVRVIEDGLKKARSGILVASQVSMTRPWVENEYAVLMEKAISGGGTLIPVLLEDVELPPLAAIRQYVDFRKADGPRYTEQVGRLIAILKGHGKGLPERKPGLLVPPPGTGYRAEGPIYRTLRIEAGETVLIGEKTTRAPHGSRLHALDDKMWQLDRELHARGAEIHRDGSGETVGAAQRLHACQLAAGAALAEVFLPEAVAEALRADLAAAVKSGSSMRLGLEVPDALLGLPWETLCLAPGEPLALHPRVSFYRRVKGLGPTPAIQVPGPLRILVAIGSPEAQNARGELLDMEAELARILDAVEPARKAGRPAYVRILENGTVAAIHEALKAERYHVLHLSCHAGPGVLILEDGDGNEDPVDAERLWSKALPADRGGPLVVLAGCATALDGSDGEKALPGLAGGLLERGVPAVVAMRASVSDVYATAFCSSLYESLAAAEEPLPLTAFVEARRSIEEQREKGAFRGRAEWSTPLLFLRGEGEAAAGLRLYDPKATPETIAEPRTVRLAAGTLVRRVGDFIGRRDDQRSILKQLREPETGGVLIRGLGGLGKSSLSAQLAQKLGGENWLVVSLYGEVDPDGIFEEVAKQLLVFALDAGLAENHPIRSLAQILRRRDLEADQRRDLLGQRLLEQIPLLLLLDNFEDSLTPISEGASAFKNPQLAALLSKWLQRPGRSRLLLTCRYKVPFEGVANHRMRDHPLGPLSPAEARKLFLRLPALDALAPEEQERARVTVGGHPRALEYLDALLQGGKTRFADLAERLEKALREKGIEEPRAWLAQQGGDFDTALAEVVTLAADDVLLDALLERLQATPLAAQLLLGASVYRLPVDERALVWQVGETPALPRDPEPDPLLEVAPPPGFSSARGLLASLGLLAPVEVNEGETRWLVHRWTATRLGKHIPAEEATEAHRRAALYWRWQVAKTQQSRDRNLLDLLEARHHHFLARDLDEAAMVTERVCLQLDTWGAYRREEQLLLEGLNRLPAGSLRAPSFLGQLGNVAYRRGDYEQALGWYQKSLTGFEKSGNRAGIAFSFHQLGVVAETRDDHDQALDWYRKSLAIREELGNRAGMASSYGQLGIVAQLRGDYEQAFDQLRKSLAIFEELGNWGGIATVFYQLGVVAQKRGNDDQALNWYRKSHAINKELGNKAGIADSFHQLGIIAQNHDDHDQALDWYRKSLSINEELDNRAGMAENFHQLGNVAYLRGDYDQAFEDYKKSLALNKELGKRLNTAHSLHQLGMVAQQHGDDQALEWYRKSLAIYEELGNQAGMALSYHQVGLVVQTRGDYDQALEWYRKSLDINEVLGNQSGVATSQSQTGVLHTERGNPAEAVSWNLRSLAIRRELQEPQVRIDLYWLNRQRQLLGDDRFREILGDRLDADSQTMVLELLAQFTTRPNDPAR